MMREKDYEAKFILNWSVSRKIKFVKEFFWKENAKSLSALGFTEEACGSTGIDQPP